MSIGAGVAIYFVIWWTILFAILPWGVRSQAEEGVIVPGSEASAPMQPRLLMKAIATTIVAGIIFAAFYWFYVSDFIGIDDIPFLPRYS